VSIQRNGGNVQQK